MVKLSVLMPLIYIQVSFVLQIMFLNRNIKTIGILCFRIICYHPLSTGQPKYPGVGLRARG